MHSMCAFQYQSSKLPCKQDEILCGQVFEGNYIFFVQLITSVRVREMGEEEP